MKANPLASLKRREAARLTVAVVTTLDSTTQLSTATTAPTRAPAAGRTPRHQVPTVARATSDVASPGIPIRPPTARPANSWGMGIAEVANRAGSSVMSAAAATTGTIPQPSRAAEPPSTTTVWARSGSCWRRKSSAATHVPTIPRAYSPPIARPTSCSGLRRSPLRNSVSFSLRRCATTRAPRSGLLRPPAGRTALRGSRRRGLLSTVPAARSRPSATTATWSHIRCTRSMTWLETITVPPLATYRSRMSRMLAAETGSTDSNGSSRTSTLGAWIRADARAIFLVMPAE